MLKGPTGSGSKITIATEREKSAHFDFLLDSRPLPNLDASRYYGDSDLRLGSAGYQAVRGCQGIMEQNTGDATGGKDRGWSILNGHTTTPPGYGQVENIWSGFTTDLSSMPRLAVSLV